MINLTGYPYPTYEPNKATGSIFAVLIYLSLMGWLIQSIQSKFQLRRPIILLFISHLAIFIELVLRATLSAGIRNSRTPFAISTVLFAVGERVIIVANNDVLVHIANLALHRSRLIMIASTLGVATSGALLGTSGALSHDPHTINRSFRLRQAAAAIILCMTILFYPLWLVTKATKNMTRQGILLLLSSSLCSLIIAIFLQVTSIPTYYLATNKQEFWFYIFQLTPIAIVLFTWTILHPKRSLIPIRQANENLMENIDNHL